MSKYLRIIGIIQLFMAAIGFFFLLKDFSVVENYVKSILETAGGDSTLDGSKIASIALEVFTAVTYLLTTPTIGVVLLALANINDKTNRIYKR